MIFLALILFHVKSCWCNICDIQNVWEWGGGGHSWWPGPWGGTLDTWLSQLTEEKVCLDTCSAVSCCVMQCNLVQRGTIKYSEVQYSAVKYSEVQWSKVQYSAVQ